MNSPSRPRSKPSQVNDNSPRAASAQPERSSRGAVRGEDAARQVARTAAQEVRILGGQWRRTPLPVPVSAGLRPTPSRVRETLFNWLGQDLQGWRVLDAFAGSGALGLEAASRGADPAVLVERDASLVRQLRSTVARLKATTVAVHQADALAWMRQPAQAGQFDLVLLDPPFDDDLFAAAVAAAMAVLTPGGWLYLEAPRDWGTLVAEAASTPWSDALQACRLHREGRAGAVFFHLLQAPDAVSPALA